MYYVYVLDPSGMPLMPTTRYGKVRRMLKTGQAVVVRTKPFTIRLTYEPATRVTQVVTLGIDPGRTNTGLAAVDTAGRCLYSAKCETRNKQIPKLMADRAVHRRASRRGERLVRKRLAKKLGTTRTFLNGRILPGCDKPILLKDIINTESRFNNRRRPEGWLTPTATQLLRTHLNLVKKVRQLLPITRIAVELNRFAFMAMDNPSIKRWQYQKGPLYGYSNIREALKELQGGEWFLEMEEQRGRQMARQMQSKLTVAKSVRRYNNLDRLLPGTVFLYEGRQYVMTGQLSGGMYLRACGTGEQNYPVSQVNTLSKNTGLIYVT